MLPRAHRNDAEHPQENLWQEAHWFSLPPDASLPLGICKARSCPSLADPRRRAGQAAAPMRDLCDARAKTIVSSHGSAANVPRPLQWCLTRTRFVGGDWYHLLICIFRSLNLAQRPSRPGKGSYHLLPRQMLHLYRCGTQLHPLVLNPWARWSGESGFGMWHPPFWS
jgi:hypothetical protein